MAAALSTAEIAEMRRGSIALRRINPNPASANLRDLRGSIET
jgi:hypothetical protein